MVQLVLLEVSAQRRARQILRQSFLAPAVVVAAPVAAPPEAAANAPPAETAAREVPVALEVLAAA